MSERVCVCPEYCPFHWDQARKNKTVCTCKEESDVPPNNNHTPYCYWVDNR